MKKVSLMIVLTLIGGLATGAEAPNKKVVPAAEAPQSKILWTQSRPPYCNKPNFCPPSCLCAPKK